MGKGQSKRSVDITTEVNKEGAAIDGESGKVGKIEDVDQLKPQLNGDTNHKDADSTANNEKQEEKKDDAENEKDAVTEKSEQQQQQPEQPEAAAEANAVNENGAGGDASIATEATETAKPAENGNDTDNVTDTTATTLNESKEVVEGGEDVNAASTPITDSSKKPKKEKSKKRFLSFRSFSFSKKDKQKPKKEESAANTTNGECEKVPEETTEEVVPTAEEKTEAQATTNGTSDEAKTDDAKPVETLQPAAAPVATPEKSVTPPAPSTDESSQPLADIKQVAQETVEEAIVAASKSVDEKINIVLAKPEVNAEKDLQENITVLESSVENVEQSNEKARVDTISNNINDNNDTDTITNSVGLGDCTNNNNNNLPPPPLPECPPPSQISVFAETAMSVDENALLPAPEIPQSIPIIDTQIQSDSALVGNTKIELTAASETVVVENLDDKPNVNVVNQHVNANGSENVERVEVNELTKVDKTVTLPEITQDENANKQLNATESVESLPKPEEIAETIAILDSVNESEVKLVDEPSISAVVVDEEIKSVTTEANTEPIKDDLSADISSPLPQNSLESLPSPQSLSSNVSPPSEVEENTATELANEDISLPPPPPSVVEITIEAQSTVVSDSLIEHKTTAFIVTESLNENGNESLPSPPAFVETDAKIETANGIDDVKTNGNSESQENIEASATNDDTQLNGSAKVGDDAAVTLSDKENGIAKENSISEKLNGDAEHKTIEDFATSPEKLEKLAAANPPPSKEVVAAE